MAIPLMFSCTSELTTPRARCERRGVSRAMRRNASATMKMTGAMVSASSARRTLM